MKSLCRSILMICVLIEAGDSLTNQRFSFAFNLLSQGKRSHNIHGITIAQLQRRRESLLEAVFPFVSFLFFLQQTLVRPLSLSLIDRPELITCLRASPICAQPVREPSCQKSNPFLRKVLLHRYLFLSHRTPCGFLHHANTRVASWFKGED